MLRRVFELRPLPVTKEKGVKESSKEASFGDIMGSVPSLVATSLSASDVVNGAVTGIKLPEAFSPEQRLLLTANGNVERIVHAYYDEPVTVLVLENQRRAK